MSDPKETRAVGRREALAGIGVTLGLAACGSAGDAAIADPTTPPDTTPTGGGGNNSSSGNPAGTGTTPPAPPPPAPAMTPAELLAGIDHVVVLMMENRSFDHFLGALKSDAVYANKAKVEGLAGTESNPAPDGSPVPVFKMTNFTPDDLPHSYEKAHAQFNGGKNDGFVKAHAGDSQNEAMGFHDRSQIPLYYWFADNFAICDHWFASVMGPTWPNRFYLHATTSKGKKDNNPFFVGAPETVWDVLSDQKVTAKNYYAGAVSWYVGGFVGKVPSMNPTAKIDAFFDAAKNGTLPSFSIIDPDFQASDDHPSHDILRGQAFVASVYKALAESPAWSKTLFVVTYDEHGGFFDHVPPPTMPDADADFQQVGFRVPAFVIGPTVKKGYVSSVVYDHASVAATLRTRFGIKDLTLRMQGAKDVSDCIDAAKVKAPAAPPLGMPQVAMTMEAALTRGVGEHSQPLLAEMIARGDIAPADVDTRTHEQRIGGWLAHAVRLGVVKIVK